MKGEYNDNIYIYFREFCERWMIQTHSKSINRDYLWDLCVTSTSVCSQACVCAVISNPLIDELSPLHFMCAMLFSRELRNV